MVLGVPEQPRALLSGQAVAVLAVLAVPGHFGQLGGDLHLPVGGGRVHEDDVDVQVEQVCHRVEDLGGDLLQRGEQEVHGPVGGIVGEPRTALDEHPLGHPPGGGQLGGRLQRPLRGQREDHPLGRLTVQPPPGRNAADGLPDLQPLPQPVQHPGPAQPPGVENLHLTTRRRSDRQLRFQEPADGGDQPPQRLPVHQVRPAEVVDHLGDRAAGPRVSLVVRQLQVRHHGAVFVPPPRLSQVHAYKTSNPGRPAPATRRKSCAYSFPTPRHLRASLTRRNSSDQAPKCLRAAEVRT